MTGQAHLGHSFAELNGHSRDRSSENSGLDFSSEIRVFSNLDRRYLRFKLASLAEELCATSWGLLVLFYPLSAKSASSSAVGIRKPGLEGDASASAMTNKAFPWPASSRRCLEKCSMRIYSVSRSKECRLSPEVSHSDHLVNSKKGGSKALRV